MSRYIKRKCVLCKKPVEKGFHCWEVKKWTFRKRWLCKTCADKLLKEFDEPEEIPEQLQRWER